MVTLIPHYWLDCQYPVDIEDCILTNLATDCRDLFPWQSSERCEEGKTSWSDQRGNWSHVHGSLYNATQEIWPGGNAHKGRHTKTNKLKSQREHYTHKIVSGGEEHHCFKGECCQCVCVWQQQKQDIQEQRLLCVNKGWNLYFKWGIPERDEINNPGLNAA